MPLFATGSGREGIVHVIGPELGLTQPGMTIVCGDSHTSTHGAFGALAFGVGTSEVEHVLATQCLPQRRPRSMRVRFEGDLPPSVTAKDMILGAIGRLGVAGGIGHVLEYTGAGDPRPLDGEPDDDLQHVDRGRGARGDDRARRHHVRLSRGPARRADRLRVGAGARRLALARVRPRRRPTTASSRSMSPSSRRRSRGGRTRRWSSPVTDRVPDPAAYSRSGPARRRPSGRSTYMGLEPGTAMQDISVDRVFIGSCTNARIEDLRAAAAVVAGKQVHPSVRALVVPGSATIKRLAEEEGLDRIFVDAGFEWRRAGCSMCLGMNPDVLADGRALRLDLEPQLRGPAGTRRPHAPGQPAARRGDRDRRPLRRPARAGDAA